MVWRLIDHSLVDRKMPVEEETYVNIDCLDTETGEAIPFRKEESHRLSSEKLEEKRNNFFMKIWNPFSRFVMLIWKYILQILQVIWKYIKRGWHFLKNKYLEFKNTQEKNK